MTVAERIRQQVERCLEEFSQGKLTAASLRSILQALEQSDQSPLQQLLFLRANGCTINSDVVSMMIMENGQITEGPADPEAWPYYTVIDAIQDGWRVIKFPELALWTDETRTYEVGCEFVLEKFGA